MRLFATNITNFIPIDGKPKPDHEKKEAGRESRGGQGGLDLELK